MATYKVSYKMLAKQGEELKAAAKLIDGYTERVNQIRGKLGDNETLAAVRNNLTKFNEQLTESRAILSVAGGLLTSTVEKYTAVETRQVKNVDSYKAHNRDFYKNPVVVASAGGAGAGAAAAAGVSAAMPVPAPAVAPAAVPVPDVAASVAGGLSGGAVAGAGLAGAALGAGGVIGAKHIINKKKAEAEADNPPAVQTNTIPKKSLRRHSNASVSFRRKTEIVKQKRQSTKDVLPFFIRPSYQAAQTF